LLFNSQPFVTKLANTLSACVLLIGDVSAFTSRSAAREEMEYELFGASMICSTWGSGRVIKQLYYNTVREKSRALSCTHQCSEVRYLEGRIVARDTSNFIISTIDLESDSTFYNMRGEARNILPERTSPFPSLHCVFGRVPGRGDRVIC